MSIRSNRSPSAPPIDRKRAIEVLRHLASGIDPETGEYISDGPLHHPPVRYALTVALEALYQVAEPGDSSTAAQPKREVGYTVKDTEELFRSGLSPQQIAKRRDLQESTIYGHLEKLVRSGDLDLSKIVAEDQQEAFRQAYREAMPVLEVQQIQAAMDPPAPYGLVCMLRNLWDLPLGRGREIGTHERERVEETILEAVDALDGTLAKHSLVRLLQGTPSTRKVTDGRSPFAALVGYDREGLLSIVSDLLVAGRIGERSGKLVSVERQHNQADVPF